MANNYDYQIVHQTAIRIRKRQKQVDNRNDLKASQDRNGKRIRKCKRNIGIEKKCKLVSGGGQTQSSIPWYNYAKITFNFLCVTRF